MGKTAVCKGKIALWMPGEKRQEDNTRLTSTCLTGHRKTIFQKETAKEFDFPNIFSFFAPRN